MSVIDKRRDKKPFGGITIVFGGDFWQILPVIPKASKAEVVCATLKKSKIWDYCEVFLLKQNMRLNVGNTKSVNKIIVEFSKWQLAVGDGTLFTYLSQDSIDYYGDDDNDFSGTRMIVKSCRKNSIECEILCGSHVGTKHIIPRIEMIPSDTNWPFEIKCVQFPIQIWYSMTINKSQGKSLNTVGLYLPRAAFSHGHIYVTISRVTRPAYSHR
ncbi:uncharacterized protein LOC141665913 [Apium graveolens]|uniref:uncharacterized protein LOC141665913 n=1 Tax=Apium graveolens TaxID=4045 RepID=UPI003D7BCB11